MQVRQKYGTVNAGSVCKATPRVYDMKEYMDLPLGDHAKTEDALKGMLITHLKRCQHPSQSVVWASTDFVSLFMHLMHRASEQAQIS